MHNNRKAMPTIPVTAIDEQARSSLPTLALALGLDAGGTSTRWAVADALGKVQHEGAAAGFSGWQLAGAEGRADIAALLTDIAQQVHAAAPKASVAALCLGLTGFDGDASAAMAALLKAALGVPAQRMRLFNDVELACRASFAPGQGVLLYAGTGSVAAYVDEHEQLHRAGGHGGLIDDGGSGYWIAREALRHIWRAEDEGPGAWRSSAMARRVFDHVGGHVWADTRNWVYGATRGELGQLAVAVAQAADSDAAAMDIVQRAAGELARLGLVLMRRCGARPLALAGRVFDLHPVIEQATRRALAPHEVLPRVEQAAHHAAARIAARTLAAVPGAPA